MWLVFSRGDVTVPSETAPKSAPPAAQVYHQMSIILDANSGELLGATLYPPTHEVAQAATLPTVVLTAGTPMVVPAAPNRTVEPALPTRSVPGRPAPQGTALPVQPVVPGATPTPAR